jgi:acetolactate synthase-1/2/3 large subunit
MSANVDNTARTGGQALVDQLIHEGVRDIFGIPGVQLDWAVDALRRRSDAIRFIVPRHEQATSYMADGYARSSGREGVCMTVPGPGVLNALSGLATAYACNSPVLLIAGQIPSAAIGRKLGLLHELPDQSRILKSMTKWHARANRPDEIPALVNEAFIQLRSGRPRPVALEIPPDVLETRCECSLVTRARSVPTQPSPQLIREAAELLERARFPVIYAGGGCRAAGASQSVAALAEALQAPVVMTEGGRGTLDDRHPLALTTLGGRLLLPRADVVLIVGSRFVDAQGVPPVTAPGAKLIYLNAEPIDMEGPRRAGLRIAGDARLGTQGLLSGLNQAPRTPATALVAKVKDWSRAQTDALRPQSEFIGALRAGMADEDILVSELTQIGYFANVAFPIHGERRLLTPGYQGTLGYGFNTAIGAAIGNADCRVVSINGDGGFGWGLQELATLARHALNLTVIVFVDGRFGNVQRIQRRVFGAEFATELQNPDYELLARAHGIPGVTVDSPSSLEREIASARERGGPAFIAVRVGEMPSPWALIHPFVPPATPPPPDPL